MKRKLLFKLWLIFWLLTSIVSLSYANYSVQLNGLSDVLQNKISWIHFAGWGNDFWGMFIVTELKDISSNPESINLGWNMVSNCKKQLRWYYWNSLRWWILYPLDQQTLNYWKGINLSNYTDLQLVWGFYTACDWDVSSIYWEIKYSSPKITDYTIQAGRQYDVSMNNVTWTNFTENFQIYNNSKILWLIVDSNYWIGFVWWKVNSLWNDLVYALNNHAINDVVTSITNTNINNTVGAEIIPLNGVIQTIIWILW